MASPCDRNHEPTVVAQPQALFGPLPGVDHRRRFREVPADWDVIDRRHASPTAGVQTGGLEEGNPLLRPLISARWRSASQ